MFKHHFISEKHTNALSHRSTVWVSQQELHLVNISND